MLFSNRYEQAVKFVSSIAPKKTSLQILTAIKVIQKKESITYESTDLDNFLRVRLPVWGDIEGEYVVDAKSLCKAPKKIATKIVGDKISLGNLTVSSMDVKEFPSLETGFFKNPTWEHESFSRHEFIEVGKRVCNYTSKDESRLSLSGVCFRDGFLYATNGNYLLKSKTGLKSKKNVEFIIPCSFFKFLSNEFVIDDEIDLSVFWPEKDKGYIIARGNSFELVSKLISEEYPIVEKVLPKEMPYSFSIEREPFLSIIKEAVKYANKKTSMAEIIPNKNGNEFTISVIDKDGGIEFKDSIRVKQISKKKWDGVAFNAKSLSVILSDCHGRIIVFKAGESQISAVTIESEIDNGELFLLMPLRKLADEEPVSDTPKNDENSKELKKEESESQMQKVSA